MRNWSLSILFLGALCQAQISARGTLVSVIPAKDGIAIAADTRVTAGDESTYCDGDSKLLVPKQRKNAVVFETGEGLLFPLFGKTVASDIHDYCGYMKSVAPLLDIAAFLAEEVDERPNQILTLAETKGIARDCVAKVAAFSHKYKSSRPLKGFRGRPMFQAVIVNFDAKHGVGLVGYFSVAVNSSERPVVIRVGLHEFLKSNKSLDAMFLFGESDYANEYVPRLGKQFLGPFLEIREKTVYRTSVKEAGAAALSFLVATEESAKIKKPTYGIGGPVDLATITNAGVTVERH